MAATGGSATLYGMYFQILRMCEWTIRLHHLQWSGSTFQEDLITLIQEPSDGGDIRIEMPSLVIVEQVKTRTSERTWRLEEVIEGIWRDLYLATDEASTRRIEFHIFAEGRRGRWGNVEAFLVRLQDAPNPRDALRANDLITYGNQEHTEASFIDHVARVVTGEEPSQESIERVLVLLGSLHMHFEQSEEVLRERALHGLLLYSPSHEAASMALRSMLGYLLSLQQEPDAAVDKRKMFIDAGLNPEVMFAVELWKRRVEQLGVEALGLGFEEHVADIRHAHLEVTRLEQVTLIAGPSGVGKSFELGHILHRLCQMDDPGLHVVHLISRARSVERVQQSIADLIWNDLLSFPDQNSLSGVHSWFRRHRVHGSPWKITCLIDEAFDTTVLQELLNYSWERVGVHIVITCADSQLDTLRKTDDVTATVDVYCLRDFDDEEVDRYLAMRGLDPSDVSMDIRRLLHRPLFAKLWGDSQDYEMCDPRSEYELLSHYIERLESRARVEGITALGDVLVRLGESILKEAQWHWRPRVLIQWLGRDANEVLERLGLFQYSARRYKLWHDRIAQWCVAMALLERYEDGVDAQEVAQVVQNIIGRAHEQSFALRYVPMDLLWLSLQESQYRPLVIALLGALDAVYGTNFEGAVGDLGDLVLEPLADYILSKEGLNIWNQNRYVDALVRIGEHDDASQAKVVDLAYGWLTTRASLPIEMIGARVISRLPNAITSARAQVIWTWHLQNTSLSADDDQDARLVWDASKALILKSLTYTPGWLVAINAAPSDQAQALAWVHIIANSPDSCLARRLWMDHKCDYMSLLPDEELSLSCMRRFRDPADIEAVLRMARLPFRDSHRYFAVELDPVRALNELRNGQWPDILSWDVRWWSLLLEADFERAWAVWSELFHDPQGRPTALVLAASDAHGCPIQVMHLLIEYVLTILPLTASTHQRNREVKQVLTSLASMTGPEYFNIWRGAFANKDELAQRLLEFIEQILTQQGIDKWQLGYSEARDLLLMMESELMSQVVHLELVHRLSHEPLSNSWELALHSSPKTINVLRDMLSELPEDGWRRHASTIHRALMLDGQWDVVLDDVYEKTDARVYLPFDSINCAFEAPAPVPSLRKRWYERARLAAMDEERVRCLNVLALLPHEDTLLILQSWWKEANTKHAQLAFKVASYTYELTPEMISCAAAALLEREECCQELGYAILRAKCESYYARLYKLLRNQEKQEMWMWGVYVELIKHEPLRLSVLHMLWRERDRVYSNHLACDVLLAWLDDPELSKDARQWIYQRARKPRWHWDGALQVESIKALAVDSGELFTRQWLPRALRDTNSDKRRLLAYAVDIDPNWAWLLLTNELIDSWSTLTFERVIDFLVIRGVEPPREWVDEKINIVSMDATLSWLAVGAPGATEQEVLSLREYPDLRVQRLVAFLSHDFNQRRKHEALLLSLQGATNGSALWWHVLSMLLPEANTRWWCLRRQEFSDHLRIPRYAKSWCRRLQKKWEDVSKKNADNWDRQWRRELS